MRIRATIVVIALAASLGSGLAAWPGTESHIDGRLLDELARITARRGKIPGAALGVVVAGRIEHTGSYGTASVVTLAPMSAETLCRIGSTSKVVTGLLFAILVEEGKIDPAAPIGNVLPDLPPRLAALTGDQLVTHLAGLQDRGDILDYWGRPDDGSLAAKVATYTDDLLFAEPGQVFSYSNLGFVLAGRLCEVAAGKPFGVLVRERVFEPVGMSSSTLRLSEAMNREFAHGHVEADHPFAGVDIYGATQPVNYQPSGTTKLAVVHPYPDNASRGPSGFVISNAVDMAKLAAALMDEGRIDGRPALPVAAVRAVTRPRVRMPAGMEGAHYGWGMIVGESRGNRIWTHPGGVPGFGCSFQMAPDRRFAVVTLVNRNGGSLRPVVDAAFKQGVPDAEGWKPSGAETVPPLTEDERRHCAGAYRNGPERVVIVDRGGRLWRSFGTHGVPLEKTGKLRFRVRGQEYAFAPAEGDGESGATYLHIRFRGYRRE